MDHQREMPGLARRISFQVIKNGQNATKLPTKMWTNLRPNSSRSHPLRQPSSLATSTMKTARTLKARYIWFYCTPLRPDRGKRQGVRTVLHAKGDLPGGVRLSNFSDKA